MNIVYEKTTDHPVSKHLRLKTASQSPNTNVNVILYQWWCDYKQRWLVKGEQEIWEHNLHRLPWWSSQVKGKESPGCTINTPRWPAHLAPSSTNHVSGLCVTKTFCHRPFPQLSVMFFGSTAIFNTHTHVGVTIFVGTRIRWCCHILPGLLLWTAVGPVSSCFM